MTFHSWTILEPYMMHWRSTLLHHGKAGLVQPGRLCVLDSRDKQAGTVRQGWAFFLQEALEGAVKLMAHYRATRMLDDNDGALFEAACTAMTGSIAPYIASCYARIYPGQGKLITVRKAVAALSSVPESNDAGSTDTYFKDGTGGTASLSTPAAT